MGRDGTRRCRVDFGYAHFHAQQPSSGSGPVSTLAHPPSGSALRHPPAKDPRPKDADVDIGASVAGYQTSRAADAICTPNNNKTPPLTGGCSFLARTTGGGRGGGRPAAVGTGTRGMAQLQFGLAEVHARPRAWAVAPRGSKSRGLRPAGGQGLTQTKPPNTTAERLSHSEQI